MNMDKWRSLIFVGQLWLSRTGWRLIGNAFYCHTILNPPPDFNWLVSGLSGSWSHCLSVSMFSVWMFAVTEDCWSSLPTLPTCHRFHCPEWSLSGMSGSEGWWQHCGGRVASQGVERPAVTTLLTTDTQDHPPVHVLYTHRPSQPGVAGERCGEIIIIISFRYMEVPSFNKPHMMLS